MAYDAVFFDLDGTLTDPTEGITKSVQYALASFGIHEPLERLIPFIGPPLHHSFMHHYAFDEPTARRAVDTYRDYFARQGMYENLLFPGIPALLGDLAARGVTLLVVTSKPAFFADQIVAHFDLARYFAAVVGSEMDLSNADKATLVRLAFDRCPDVAPGRVVMVGDREHDIIGARANGIASIGVTYGAGSADELRRAGATHLAHSVAELDVLLR